MGKAGFMGVQAEVTQPHMATLSSEPELASNLERQWSSDSQRPDTLVDQTAPMLALGTTWHCQLPFTQHFLHQGHSQLGL